MTFGKDMILIKKSDLIKKIDSLEEDLDFLGDDEMYSYKHGEIMGSIITLKTILERWE